MQMIQRSIWADEFLSAGESVWQGYRENGLSRTVPRSQRQKRNGFRFWGQRYA